MADNAKFFESPQAAAVYKHRLLRSYVPVFAGKTGSFSGGRVVVYDAYSGPGRYGDAQPGSPELLVELAISMAALRTVTTVFSESDQAYCDELEALIREKDVDPQTYEIRRGPVEDHLEDVVASAGDLPLFIFLDPFGLTISFERLVQLITMRRRPGGRYRQPVTEVLMNFSYEAVRRISGAVRSSKEYSSKTGQIESLNKALGGDWWHPLAAEEPNGWVEDVLSGFAHRVKERVGGGYITASVADSLTAKPVYELILFTQHFDGLWAMMEAMGKARRDWRAWLASQKDQQVITALDFEDNQEAWVDEIAANVAELLAEKGPFVIQDEIQRMFGRAFGFAWGTHVTQALKRLQRTGVLGSVPPVKQRQYAVLQPATPHEPPPPQ